jgi:hypothetical protein
VAVRRRDGIGVVAASGLTIRCTIRPSSSRVVAALQDVILRDNDSRAKTVSVVRQKIHDPKDVPMAARVLEDIGVQFETVSRVDAQRTIAIMGALRQAAQAQNLGVFNAHAPH